MTDKPIQILVNAADDPERGAIYLTVTGTSAESGDDGETGRGNRSNGLITPLGTMSLEAAAGKNPLTHVGKLYGAMAQQIAESLVDEIGEVQAAECYLVSRIGAPINQPQTVTVRLNTIDEHIAGDIGRRVNDIVVRELPGVVRLWERFLVGGIPVC